MYGLEPEKYNLTSTSITHRQSMYKLKTGQRDEEKVSYKEGKKMKEKQGYGYSITITASTYNEQNKLIWVNYHTY